MTESGSTKPFAAGSGMAGSRAAKMVAWIDTANHERLLTLLNDCDSELSAIQHGRPPSPKVELADLVGRIRQFALDYQNSRSVQR